MEQIEKHSRVYLDIDTTKKWDYVVIARIMNYVTIQRMTPDPTEYFEATVHVSQLEFIC